VKGAGPFAGQQRLHTDKEHERKVRTQSGYDPAVLAVIDACAPADQAHRLKRFRQEHPEVEIITRGPWQATMHEPGGERTIVRWELRDLLGKLDELFAAAPEDASVTG
jgi:hypothetical protein